ncbi:MAG TPA: response regulator [Kofleriaceae bacterium]|nr:response regulator [Kofleriaceae bacterium]
MTRILVVEDDEDLRAVVLHGLHTDGRTLLEADDGLAALTLIESQGLPDLILLDMNMPGMNGWQFAEELRARGLWRVPVIVITAAHDAARSAHEIGAADYLGKPFELRALRSLVEKLLARATASAHV